MMTDEDTSEKCSHASARESYANCLGIRVFGRALWRAPAQLRMLTALGNESWPFGDPM